MLSASLNKTFPSFLPSIFVHVFFLHFSILEIEISVVICSALVIENLGKVSAHALTVLNFKVRIWVRFKIRVRCWVRFKIKGLG